MSAQNLESSASLVQRDMARSVAQFRPQMARTLATFQTGTRKDYGTMAGKQIPYWRDKAHGQTWYNPLAADYSFKGSLKQRTGAMFAGVVFRNMNFQMEAHWLRDLNSGKIPDSYLKERRRRMATHFEKKNWGAIGTGKGIVAVVTSSVAGLLTLTKDNNDRERSKGSYRLSVSTSDEQLLYDGINNSTGAVVATFYVTAKPASTQANITFTVGNDAALNNAGFYVVESDSYNKEIMGIGGHNSDVSRLYQGALTADDPFLNAEGIDQGDTAITPTSINTAKAIARTRANSNGVDKMFVCHLTDGNYTTLANYGYTQNRTYNAEGGKAQKTFGLPNIYEDGDTVFVPDADYEEGYIDFRHKTPYFEYVQKPFGLKTVGGQSRHEHTGTYGYGSTLEYENYNEACNIIWDGRGMNDDGAEGGSPNSGVFIKNITIPTVNQADYGV